MSFILGHYEPGLSHLYSSSGRGLTDIFGLTVLEQYMDVRKECCCSKGLYPMCDEAHIPILSMRAEAESEIS